MKRPTCAEFDALKRDVESHPRLSGYYLIDLVDIADLRAARRSEEEIAEIVFRHFDDQEWPPPERRPTDQTWTDYATDPAKARELAIEALVGGPAFGHTVDTIAPYEAERYVERFEALFPAPKTYYTGMDFGDHEFVFLHGLAIIARQRAGLLWVVESD